MPLGLTITLHYWFLQTGKHWRCFPTARNYAKLTPHLKYVYWWQPKSMWICHRRPPGTPKVGKTGIRSFADLGRERLRRLMLPRACNQQRQCRTSSAPGQWSPINAQTPDAAFICTWASQQSNRYQLGTRYGLVPALPCSYWECNFQSAQRIRD